MEIDKHLYHLYENGGMKECIGKRDYTLLPWQALNDVVDIMAYGAKKYNRDNWMKVPKEEYVKALFRHLIQYIQGEDYDKESGFHHLAHLIADGLYAYQNFLSDMHIPMEEVSKDKNKEVQRDDEKQLYFDFEVDTGLSSKEIDKQFREILGLNSSDNLSQKDNEKQSCIDLDRYAGLTSGDINRESQKILGFDLDNPSKGE